eukprot:TRINITY_DN45864_c0_g1_i1.p1 TRINITY_DN45864_c0_g1~~TRINITY_DN45864_c0_g1_i1.p1  ORF type:complete len:165 (-),score=3.54 TRINITY_DN45864_c0_g1_i1:283-777(-)
MVHMEIPQSYMFLVSELLLSHSDIVFMYPLYRFMYVIVVCVPSPTVRIVIEVCVVYDIYVVSGRTFFVNSNYFVVTDVVLVYPMCLCRFSYMLYAQSGSFLSATLEYIACVVYIPLATLWEGPAVLRTLSSRGRASPRRQARANPRHHTCHCGRYWYAEAVLRS